MTEEEKKAMEILKYQLTNRETDIYTPINYFAIETILNLIDKKQKEIEVLKEKNTDLEKDFRTYTRKVINSVFQDEFIHKDKIREKIKQLEIVKNTPVRDNSYTYKECIEYGIEELNELLEE